MINVLGIVKQKNDKLDKEVEGLTFKPDLITSKQSANNFSKTQILEGSMKAID